MGPLFSAAIVVVVLSVGLLFAFVIARFFYTTAVAICAAAIFVFGGAVGVVLAVIVLSLFIGVGGTLTSGVQVAAYLSALGIGGVLVGGLLAWWYLRAQSSNSSLKAAPFGRCTPQKLGAL